MYNTFPIINIPGNETVTTFKMTIEVGGLASLNGLIVPVAEPGTIDVVIDYNDLIGTSSDTTTHPGSVTIINTTYCKYDIVYSSCSVLVDEDYYLTPYVTNAIGPASQAKNIIPLTFENVTSGAANMVMEGAVLIYIVTLEYWYPVSYTVEELLEDLKTLPEIVINGLRNSDDATLKAALALLNA